MSIKPRRSSSNSGRSRSSIEKYQQGQYLEEMPSNSTATVQPECMMPLDDKDGFDSNDSGKASLPVFVSEDFSESNILATLTEQEAHEIAKLRAKIDRRLVPLVSTLYLCSFLDRVNIGNAKVAGIAHDLNLTSSEYNWALSIFFVGYVLFEVPSNICLKLVGPRIWISAVMVTWGGIMMAMAAVKDATGLLVARFFLGVAECGLFPGVVYLFSLWYTKNEQALRNGIFFSTATLAGAFGGILAYYIAQMEGIRGLHGWQWIFLLEGLPTVLLTAVVYIRLPDFPENARFLNERERELAVKRLRVDAGQTLDTSFSWVQCRMVFTDWKVYTHMAMYILSTIPLYSLAFFLPSIIVGFNLRTKERGFHFAVPAGLACIGYILLIITREGSTLARYICLTITVVGNFCIVPPMVSWFTSNIGGQTKRGVATAAIISFGNIGGAIGGQVYRGDDELHGYVRGHTICAILLAIEVCLVLTMKILLKRENQRRDRLSPEEFSKEAAKGKDLCDLHPAWRYWT
ncbi:hypothetical protein EDD11_000733 [Mortierella claussenii]|nr:hypothetical protein EDD11_000733 [Mortierella claussenii]